MFVLFKFLQFFFYFMNFRGTIFFFIFWKEMNLFRVVNGLKLTESQLID